MLNKIMKVILIVSYLLILTSCDPRIELSDFIIEAIEMGLKITAVKK